MEHTRLSSKGQIVLPKSIRERHHWLPGIEFAVEDFKNGILLKPIKPFKSSNLKQVIGCTGYQGPAKTLKEMEQAIRREAKKHK